MGFSFLYSLSPISAKNHVRFALSSIQITALFHLREWHTGLLVFMQSLAMHRHEEVIQRLSQRGMCKDAVTNNGIRQLGLYTRASFRRVQLDPCTVRCAELTSV